MPRFICLVPHLFVLLVLAFLIGLGPSAAAAPAGSITVQILALNDFHGALDPSLTKPIATDESTWYYTGGVEYLTKIVKDYAARNPYTVQVSAGDMVGASPVLSALFHDEPTVMAFNRMGFDFNVPGNHEFDEGWQELLRLQDGGCHPTDKCYTGVPAFPGASFKYLAANVIRGDNGQTLFPAFMVREFDGVKVAFIGIALESTPGIVVPSGVEGLQFKPETDTINSIVKSLKDTQGIRAFIVLLHDGAGPASSPDTCNLNDPFFARVVMKLDPEVDALITGHSHNVYNCQVTVNKDYGPMLVTSAANNARYLTDINLTIDRASDQVTARTATNIPVKTMYSGAIPDADMKALLDQYRVVAVPLANRVIGSVTADLTRTPNNAGESALGDVIADAQLEATAAAAKGGAVVAMTNPGGIRADLLYRQASGNEAPGQVTFGEAFAVQPFSNSLVTLSMTGAQLQAVLEQQFLPTVNRRLQISASLTYSWRASAPVGRKITDLKITGVPVDPAARYRVTVNNYLAEGGDGFSEFTKGTNPLTGEIDLDAFAAYLTAHSPVSPTPRNRINLLP